MVSHVHHIHQEFVKKKRGFSPQKKKTTAVASEGKKFRSCAEKIKLWRKSSESKNPGEITHFDDENLMLWPSNWWVDPQKNPKDS